MAILSFIHSSPGLPDASYYSSSPPAAGLLRSEIDGTLFYRKVSAAPAHMLGCARLNVLSALHRGRHSAPVLPFYRANVLAASSHAVPMPGEVVAKDVLNILK